MKKEILENTDEKTEDKIRQEILGTLREEAEKPADRMDAERIDRLVGLLDKTGNRKEDVSDYEEFLKRFNQRNGTSLEKHSTKIKENKNSEQKHTFKTGQYKFRMCYRLAVFALVLITVYCSSNAIVKASANQSIVSLMASGCKEVIFNLQNTVYKGWLKDKEPADGHAGTENGTIGAGGLTIFSMEKLKDCGIMLPSYLPEGFSFNYAHISDFDTNYGTININYYNKSNMDTIRIRAFSMNSDNGKIIERPDSNSQYLKTIHINGYEAYIFSGDNREAFFSKDGITYWISADVSTEEICMMVENMDYQE